MGGCFQLSAPFSRLRLRHLQLWHPLFGEMLICNYSTGTKRIGAEAILSIINSVIALRCPESSVSF